MERNRSDSFSTRNNFPTHYAFHCVPFPAHHLGEWVVSAELSPLFSFKFYRFFLCCLPDWWNGVKFRTPMTDFYGRWTAQRELCRLRPEINSALTSFADWCISSRLGRQCHWFRNYLLAFVFIWQFCVADSWPELLTHNGGVSNATAINRSRKHKLTDEYFRKMSFANWCNLVTYSFHRIGLRSVFNEC